jgi:hypothetical protein
MFISLSISSSCLLSNTDDTEAWIRISHYIIVAQSTNKLWMMMMMMEVDNIVELSLHSLFLINPNFCDQTIGNILVW